jgi:hypothetical protein
MINAQFDDSENVDLGFARQMGDDVKYENFQDYNDPEKLADVECQTCQSMIRYLAKECPINHPHADGRVGGKLNEKHLRFQEVARVGLVIDDVCGPQHFVETDYPPPVLTKSCEKIRDSNDLTDQFEEIFTFRTAKNTEKTLRERFCQRELKLCTSIWEDDIDAPATKSTSKQDL